MIQYHKLAGSKAVQKLVTHGNPSQMVNVSLEPAAATGRWKLGALKEVNLQFTVWCKRSAKTCFHFYLKASATLKLFLSYTPYGKCSGSIRNSSFHTVDISFSEWVGCRGANAADAQLGPMRSGHRCRVSPSSIYEMATFSTLKAWNINPAPSVHLFVNKGGLCLPSHPSCGQPDGLISGSLAAFRHKLRGGDGLRSAGSLLPSQGSHKAQAGLHWEIVNILISTGVARAVSSELLTEVKL